MMQLSEARQRVIGEQTFMQKVGAAISSWKDRAGTAIAKRGEQRASQLIFAFKNVVEKGMSRGIKIREPFWDVSLQKFTAPIEFDGAVPTSIEQLGADKRWGGSLLAWIQRANSSKYVVDLEKIKGGYAITIDPVPDREDLLDFYGANGKDSRRDASKKEHRDKMNKEELMAALIGGKAKLWSFTDDDMEKLVPNKSSKDAKVEILKTLFSNADFSKSINVADLNQYLGMAEQNGMDMKEVSDLWAPNLDQSMIVDALVATGLPRRSFAGVNDKAKLLHDLALAVAEDVQSSNPIGRKSVSAAAIAQRVGTGKTPITDLDEDDIKRALSAFPAAKIPTDPQAAATLLLDLARLTFNVRGTSDIDLLKGVVNLSYTGKELVEALVKAMDKSQGIQRAQAIVRSSGQIPKSIDVDALGKQIDAIAKMPLPQTQQPIPQGKGRVPTAKNPPTNPPWVKEVEKSIKKIASQFRAKADAARQAAGKQPVQDADFQKQIATELQQYVGTTKAPHMNSGDYIRAATQVMDAVEQALTNMP